MSERRAGFRPCIDLHDGKVKQIVGGSLRDDGNNLRTNFVAEEPPCYFAQLYAKDNLTGGHVIKLGPGNDEAAREALAAWPGHLQLGGGVNADNAREWLDAGADKVIVTSFLFSGGILQEENRKRLLQKIGKDHLVLDLSCRKKPDGFYYVVTDRWQKFTSYRICRETLARLADSAAEYLIHAVDVEGKCGGVDEELLQLLAENSPIDCVYAGGIRSIGDIERIESAGKGRIHYTVGSALDLFGGTLSYREIVQRSQKSL